MAVSKYFQQYVSAIFNGNQAATARALGIHRSAINHILQGKRGLTPNLAKKAEELSGGRFKKEDFIWPKDEQTSKNEQLNSQNMTGKRSELKNTKSKDTKKIDVNQDLSDKINIQTTDKDLIENDHKHKYHNCQSRFTNQHNFKSDLLGNLSENADLNNALNIGISAENSVITNNLNKKNSADTDGLADNAEIATLPLTDEVIHRINNTISNNKNEAGGAGSFYLNDSNNKTPFNAGSACSHSSNLDTNNFNTKQLQQADNSAENEQTADKNLSGLTNQHSNLPVTVTQSKDGLNLSINLNLQGLAVLNSKIKG